MTQYPVGPQATQIWTGGGPVLFANQDITKTVTVGGTPNVFDDSPAAVPIPPLGSIAVEGLDPWWAIAPAGTAALLIIPGGTSWSPAPADVALQIASLGLALDTTVQATNGQLATGVAPAVTGLDSGAQILQGPGIYTMYRFNAQGRLWAANVSFAMGSSGGSGTNQGYARVRIQSGATLAICECCVVGSPDADSNGDSQSFNGLELASGTLIQLDVNSGNLLSGVVQRGSGLVVVSIP